MRFGYLYFYAVDGIDEFFAVGRFGIKEERLFEKGQFEQKNKLFLFIIYKNNFLSFAQLFIFILFILYRTYILYIYRTLVLLST